MNTYVLQKRFISLAIMGLLCAQGSAYAAIFEQPTLTHWEFGAVVNSILKGVQANGPCSTDINGQPQLYAKLNMEDAALFFMCIIGQRFDSKKEAVEALAKLIVIPAQADSLVQPITRTQVGNIILRLRRKNLLNRKIPTTPIPEYIPIQSSWETYINKNFGFEVKHPKGVRVIYDESSKALRFQKMTDGEWKTGWTIWRNDRDIERFSTMDGVLNFVHPDGMNKKPNAVKTVRKETIIIDGYTANYVTVLVTNENDAPWIYRIVFLDLCDRQYEISGQTSDWPFFKEFARSFKPLQSVKDLQKECEEKRS